MLRGPSPQEESQVWPREGLGCKASFTHWVLAQATNTELGLHHEQVRNRAQHVAPAVFGYTTTVPLGERCSVGLSPPCRSQGQTQTLPETEQRTLMGLRPGTAPAKAAATSPRNSPRAWGLLPGMPTERVKLVSPMSMKASESETLNSQQE